jgi:hypothetical protein
MGGRALHLYMPYPLTRFSVLNGANQAYAESLVSFGLGQMVIDLHSLVARADTQSQPGSP